MAKFHLIGQVFMATGLDVVIEADTEDAARAIAIKDAEDFHLDVQEVCIEQVEALDSDKAAFKVGDKVITDHGSATVVDTREDDDGQDQIGIIIDHALVWVDAVAAEAV